MKLIKMITARINRIDQELMKLIDIIIAVGYKNANKLIEHYFLMTNKINQYQNLNPIY